MQFATYDKNSVLYNIFIRNIFNKSILSASVFKRIIYIRVCLIMILKSVFGISNVEIFYFSNIKKIKNTSQNYYQRTLSISQKILQVIFQY